MAETSNVARMASKISDSVFKVLGWSPIGSQDQNWACVTDSHEKATHPSDVVFFYDDPYRSERIFWNVDLKSYAAATITKGKLGSAISSLAKSVECANTSAEWRALYGDDENNWRCDGLLFVYNHDGEFAGDFRDLLAEVDGNYFRVAARKRIAILGPEDVSYLTNITNDLTLLRGRQLLPLESERAEFWYPDLVRPKKRSQARSAATIEMLTGPWLTLRVMPEYNGGKRKFLVYYRGDGQTVEEFKYMLDSFFRFQMLAVDHDATVEVRLVAGGKDALGNFRRAKEGMSSALYGHAQTRLDAVHCESIIDVVKKFDITEVGMEPR